MIPAMGGQALSRFFIFLLLGLFFTAGSDAGAFGAEQFSAGPNNRGVLSVGAYQVFPENRPSNGVYLRNRLVFTDPGFAIVDILPVSTTGRFVYLALDDAGNAVLKAYTRGADRLIRITEISPGFFQVLMFLKGLSYKKLYRIKDQKIVDALPSSRTADGPVVGPEGIVFYHIASIDRREETTEGPTFVFRLHLVQFNEDRTRHLSHAITNKRPRVRLRWLSNDRIRVRLTQGRRVTIRVSRFR